MPVNLENSAVATGLEKVSFHSNPKERQCQRMLKVSEVTQSCLTLCDPMDCSLPGSSIHGIFQGRVLEWVAISFSRGIFLTQGLNPGPLHCRQMLYCLSHQGRSSKNAQTTAQLHLSHTLAK